jgi:hypothetical protein
MSICQHIGCMESLNGYILLMPTLKDRASAVTSTKTGNIPFNEATLAGIIMGNYPNPGRNSMI